MIKVKCIGSLMSLGYFRGEEYEITQEIFDSNPGCFEKINQPEIIIDVTSSPVEDNKVMTSKDVKKKSK